MNKFLRKIIGLELEEDSEWVNLDSDEVLESWKELPDYWHEVHTYDPFFREYMPHVLYIHQGEFLFPDEDYYFKKDFTFYPHCYKTSFDYIWEGVSLYSFDFEQYRGLIFPENVEYKVFKSWVNLYNNQDNLTHNQKRELWDLVGKKYRFKK